jgi:hypothetical protein
LDKDTDQLQTRLQFTLLPAPMLLYQAPAVAFPARLDFS